MATPIKLSKFDDRLRIIRGRSFLPTRNQATHGANLRTQLLTAVRQFNETQRIRTPQLPDIPPGVQVLIKGATTSTGKALLDSTKLKGLKLEILEERQGGVVIAISKDPELTRLSQAIQDFRTDAHTRPTSLHPRGIRKRGTASASAIAMRT